MINLFAACRHRNYAKCSRLYLQEMLSLSDTNPWLNKQFEDAYHAVRQTNRFWAGFWSDLIIEQTLMWSIKCTGGITRGRDFKDSLKNLWIMSISYSAAVQKTSWTSSERLMYVKFTSCAYWDMIKLSLSIDQNIDMEMKSVIATMVIVNNFSTGSKLEIHLI